MEPLVSIATIVPLTSLGFCGVCSQIAEAGVMELEESEFHAVLRRR